MKLALFRRKHKHFYLYSHMTQGEKYTGPVVGFNTIREITGGYTMIYGKCECGQFWKFVFPGKFSVEECKEMFKPK